ncbi:L-histidine N(alpha)-methyltransferase [Haloechinothrix sp. YIM 98757]|uniref:Histidine N-alpha-methyltransferase n=1 Tax=Haloechinothrix aidingensis TaxID=2752311 RepID=A0A837ZXI1_9PSEU|nr:L-histidine N(alpha)-methyltransferase [Haloechinothrix aidingensis]MBA0124874.1 L-histidine N(alpha)-methyltransferase [Haloechinothrix aidingensis]
MPPATVEIRHTPEQAAEALRADALTGLTSMPKWLPPKWFYDARGSELFEDITRLPEYYPARAEREILAERAPELATITRPSALVELGSGSSVKTRLLLDAFSANGAPDGTAEGTPSGILREFFPLDVSEQALREAAHAIAETYPALRVHGVVDDFTSSLAVPDGSRPRLVAFLGGTIGNLLPDERAKFLTSLRDALDGGEWLLLGTDLVKDPDTLVRAYADSQGVTGEFNRNVLHVLNAELDADFVPEAFTHRAVWDERQEWIEMRLRAERDMRVTLPGIDLEINFTEGEEMRTEVSTKFRREHVASELVTAGFELHSWWTDAAGRFALSLARATP